MGGETRSYWAFLSYSHGDEAFTRRLHRALESYRVPRGVHATRRLKPVFRDRDELPASSDLGEAIRRALGASRALVVVCSPRSAGSKWVDAEIRHFLEHGPAERVLAVIPESEGAGAEGRHVAPTFPPALGSEPIAADARRGADGLHGAVLKLVAGILGVELDALVRRDRRRRRRALAACAVVAAGLAVGAYLGWQHVRGVVDTTGQEAEARAKRTAAAEHGSTQAREAALRGDPLAVKEAIRPTREVEPERWDAALLDFVAQRRLVGLTQPPIDVGERVMDLTLLAGGHHAWVRGERTREAWLLDWPKGTRVRRLEPSPTAEEVGVHPSPDGRSLLLVDSERVRLQDVSTGSERVIEAPPGSLAAWLGTEHLVVATVDGRRMGEVRVVAAGDGSVVRRFPLGDGDGGGLTGSRDGKSAVAWWWKTAASGDGDTPMATWFAATGEGIAEIPRDDDVTDGGLDPTGTRLLVAAPAGGWEVRARDGSRWTVPGEKGTVRARWSGGGAFCVFEDAGVVTVRDGAAGDELWSDVSNAWETDAGDRWFAQTDDQGIVRVRALATGDTVREFRDQVGWPGPGDFPHDSLIRFSPDGETLILTGAGSRVKLWRWREVRPDQRTFRLPGKHRPAHAVLAGPQRVVLIDERPRMSCVDLEAGAVRLLDADVAREEGVWCMAGAEGLVVLGTKEPAGEPAVTVRDPATGAQRGALAIDPVVLSGPTGTLTQSPQYVRVLADRMHVVAVGLDSGRARFWRAADLSFAGSATLSPATPSIQVPDAPGRPRVALSSSGGALAVAGLDRRIYVVSVPEGRALARLEHPHEGLSWVAPSPDARHVASADREHLLLWDVAAGTSRELLGESDAAANEAVFTGDVLAVACSDDVVRVWSVATDGPPRSFEPARLAGDDNDSLGAWVDTSDEDTKTGLVALRADPRGRWVAALSDKGSLCLWNLASGVQVIRWRLTPDRYARLLVTEAGERLVVVESDGSVTSIELR